MIRARHKFLFVILMGSPVASADLTADQTPFNAYRGLWVNRFEYSLSNSSIDAVFTNAQSLGITDVMFQVRGRADAYYNSDYEHEVSSSYDALARALQQGAAKGIKVHAWINTMPLWNGTTLPSGSTYLINQHPEYWIRDSTNTPQPLDGDYVIVNPTMPEVKQHIWNVVDDITTKYNVAGVHLDYIRLYEDASGSTVTYPSDPATVARFQALPGNAGKTPTSHSTEYKAWLASEITALVAGVRQTMKDNRPTAQLTAAVWRDANIGYNSYQQDWKTWVDRDLLDAAMPMIYRKGFGDGSIAGTSADGSNLYRNNVTAALNWQGNSGIMPGLGPYLQDDAATAYGNFFNQLKYANDQGANGVQLYSYAAMVGTTTISSELRRAWADFRAAYGGTPTISSITNFEVDEGYFPTGIHISGSNVNVASSSTANRDTTTAAVGTASQKLIINKTGAGTFLARHLSGIGSAGNPASNITFASVGALGFWLKTSTTDLEVAPAVDDFSDNTSTERGYFQNIIADGQWHYYQWMLNDVTHWDDWAGANDDGTVESLFTLDSIQIRGSADVNTVFLDDVAFNPAAIAANQWTLNSASNVNSANNHWTNAANWTGGVPNAVGAAANLLRRAAAAQQINVNANVTVGTLTLDNLNGYTLNGSGTLTMDSSSTSAAISVVNRGAHTIAAALKFNDNTDITTDWKSTLTMSGPLDNSLGKTLAKLGDGTLVIFGAQNHGTGAAFVAARGVTDFNSSATGSKLSITVQNGAKINLNASQQLAGLSIVAGGTIDLKNYALTIDHAGASLVATIKQMLTDSRLVSSSLSGDLLIGVGEAGDLSSTFPINFAGFPNVDSTTTLVRLTTMGDANLDGTVSSLDFAQFTAFYGTSSNARWTQADFNGDGRVNTQDFNLLTGNFGDSVVLPGASLGAVIPEPSTTALFALAGAGYFSTKRKYPRNATTTP